MKKTTITAPKGLTRTGLAFWRRVKASLEESGKLDSTDSYILQLAAENFEEQQRARKDVLKHGMTLRTTSERGYEITKSNPSVAALNQAATRLLNCLDKLGLTPAARGKTKRGNGAGLGDPIGDLLNE